MRILYTYRKAGSAEHKTYRLLNPPAGRFRWNWRWVRAVNHLAKKQSGEYTI